MTDNIKVLAQLSPSTNSLTDFYTVPSVTSTAASSIIICNQNSAITISFRISIAVAGAADDIKQYIYFDLPLSSNDTFIATVGLTLKDGDIIRVRSDNTNVSFSLFGVEVI